LARVLLWAVLSINANRPSRVIFKLRGRDVRRARPLMPERRRKDDVSMKRLAAWTIALLLGLAVPSWADAIWVETGDAGDLPTSAQDLLGDGVFTTILGNLASPDPFGSAFDIDLYRFYLSDPASFGASTVNSPGFYVSDPQLFLFDASGHGVYMNDDDESGLNGSQSALPSGHPFGPVSIGLYYLAIGWWDNEPLDALGSLIFDNASLFGTNGPALGSGKLAFWDQNVLLRPDLETAYEIRMTGVTTPIPEPGTFVLVAVGLLGVARRRMNLKRRSASR
jgi:hypothetical protein